MEKDKYPALGHSFEKLAKRYGNYKRQQESHEGWVQDCLRNKIRYRGRGEGVHTNH
jgi:hypothetical protein